MSLLPGQRVLLEKNGRWADRTESISRLRRDGNLIRVTFRNGRTFNYGSARAVIVGNAMRIVPLPIVRDQANQKPFHVTSVEQWQEIHTGRFWLRLHSRSGNPLWRLRHEIELQQDALALDEIENPRAYLTEMADAVHNVESTDSDGNGAAGLALRPKIENLPPTTHGSVLGSFLMGREFRTPPAGSEQIIAPWATNLSQLSALHGANSAAVSVIQGPPGTGKTQTILALIANALVRGETVAVVSSNNTAVDNVKLKLEESGLGFLTARLGSKKHRDEFIENQQSCVPASIFEWIMPNTNFPALVEQAALSVHQLRAGLTAINEIASLRHERRALVIETRHFGNSKGNDAEVIEQLRRAAARIPSSDYMHAVLSAEEREPSRWSQMVSWFNFRRRTVRRLLADISPQARREIWYEKRLAELDTSIAQREEFLKALDWETLHARAQTQSLRALQAAVALRRGGEQKRAQFTSKLWGKETEFLHEYPVVFSTMQSLPGTFKPGFQFDWVIVDEASQASLLTGVLAMSCAKRLVVVGDEKQLPRVLPTSDAQYAEQVEAKYAAMLGTQPWLSYVEHSFLGAVLARWDGQIPVTLLREHYRCAPLLAGFINQRFYGGQLRIMTKDDDTHPSSIQVTLGRGKNWDNINRHQVEEIINQISVGVGRPKDVGVIAPYRNQVTEVSNRLRVVDPQASIEVDTVHAYQGREKPVVILTTVDGRSEFVNEPRLVNVAVSRAQKRLILVADEEDEFRGGLIGDLIRYVRYHDASAVKKSEVRSVFELLAAAQAPVLARIQKKRTRHGHQESPAEAIMANLLGQMFGEPEFEMLEFAQEYALLDLVGQARLTAAEQGLAQRGSRVDFLIYNALDKTPLGVIEVDGATYHRRGSAQSQRDELKNAALGRAGIPLLRLPTDGAGEEAKVREFLRVSTRAGHAEVREPNAQRDGKAHTIPLG